METNKYPDYIMRMLRQRRGLEPTDTSLDERLNSYSPAHAFSEVLIWEGLLGGWDSQIKGFISGIYGIDLDEISESRKS